MKQFSGSVGIYFGVTQVFDFSPSLYSNSISSFEYSGILRVKFTQSIARIRTWKRGPSYN